MKTEQAAIFALTAMDQEKALAWDGLMTILGRHPSMRIHGSSFTLYYQGLRPWDLDDFAALCKSRAPKSDKGAQDACRSLLKHLDGLDERYALEQPTTQELMVEGVLSEEEKLSVEAMQTRAWERFPSTKGVLA